MKPAFEHSAFLAVSQSGSFSAAARSLHVTTAAVSKAVSRLEQNLGVRLFTRTTRSVVATPDGEQFFAALTDALDRLEQAHQTVREQRTVASGVVVVSAPVLFGQNVLLPMLKQLALAHPQLVVDVRLSDTLLDLVAQRIDWAIRLGELADSNLIARPLCSTRFVVCGSPRYLKDRGAPGSIAELRRHRCVVYAVQKSGQFHAWRFSRNASYLPSPPALVVNDGGANRAAALAGIGLIQELDVAVAPDLHSGLLLEVLPGRSTAGPPLNLVRPQGRFVSARARLFEDWLRQQFDR